MPTYNVNIKLLTSRFSYFCSCLSLYLFRINVVFSCPLFLISLSFHVAFVKLIPIPIHAIHVTLNTHIPASKYPYTAASRNSTRIRYQVMLVVLSHLLIPSDLFSVFHCLTMTCKKSSKCINIIRESPFYMQCLTTLLTCRQSFSFHCP